MVPVPGRAELDVDLLAGMGVEFIGEGPEVSEISIVGTVQSMGRTNFKNLSISFYQGSLNISGPLIFRSSQVLNINRCPPFFTEYNGLCFTFGEGSDLKKKIPKGGGGWTSKMTFNQIIFFTNTQKI